ncbi:MAG: DUF5615 family PIN-like protein [Acidobacteriota bacterium]|nr:MAG: DUF5615 family PIN-like protein [Acidobacteriota bacterium]
MRRLEPGLDVLTAHQAGLRGRPDPKVLQLAAQEGRVLITADKATMPMHFAAFIAVAESPGVLIVPRHLTVRDTAEALLLIWGATEAEEWVNRITYLPA